MVQGRRVEMRWDVQEIRCDHDWPEKETRISLTVEISDPDSDY